jgi:serpin B
MYRLFAISCVLLHFYACSSSAGDTNSNGASTLKQTYAVKIIAPQDEAALAFDAPAPDWTAERYVKGNNTFALNLLKKLSADSKEANIFYSPYSISTAFLQVYLGTNNKSTQEISKVFGWAANSEQHHQIAAKIDNELKPTQDNYYRLSVANRIWLNKDFPLYATYQKRAAQLYKTEFEAIDFDDDAAEDHINKWIAAKTNDMIKNFYSPKSIESTVPLIIMSAIYFEASWVKPFKDARPKLFHTPNAGAKTVNMMNKSIACKYVRGNNYQAVAVPYRDSALAMYLILPDSSIQLADFIQNIPDTLFDYLIKYQHVAPFDADDVHEILNQSDPDLFAKDPDLYQQRAAEIMKDTSGKLAQTNVYMPKWTFNATFKLKDALSILGMSDIFDKMDASKMTNGGNLAVNQVVHKTIIEVSEQGTKAAAVTAVELKTRSMEPLNRSNIFNANRPFIYFIAHEKTGVILFIGTVQDPTITN